MDPSATEAVTVIRSRTPDLKAGTLRMFGEFFGRPYDNLHSIVGAVIEADCLVVHFDQGETLRVWDPREVIANRHTFRVTFASRVRWTWFSYGSRHTPADVCFMDFRHTDEGVLLSWQRSWSDDSGSIILKSSPVDSFAAELV